MLTMDEADHRNMRVTYISNFTFFFQFLLSPSMFCIFRVVTLKALIGQFLKFYKKLSPSIYC